PRRPVSLPGEGRGEEPRPDEHRADDDPEDAARWPRRTRPHVTAHVVDMNIADDQDRQSSGGARRTELSYVLVADADVQRTAACVESIKAFNLGVLVARDGEEALGILRRFGAPILLITDLTLPRKDGFALIEAVRDIDGGRTEIIAWS